MIVETHPPDTLGLLLQALPDLRAHHAPTCDTYALLRTIARAQVKERFGRQAGCHRFEPFGMLEFPYVRMGAIDSIDLFGLDELVLFSFYWRNRNRYRRVLDLGANIGLHSIILSRCGFEVRSFEPDPAHFELLSRNLAMNAAGSVLAVNGAISTDSGCTEFVRVLGNTTGSHLAGAKEHVYGEVERFPVALHAFGPHMRWAHLVKMDVEGHEAALLCSTAASDWDSTDAMVEIGSARNAAQVFEHFARAGVNLFAQKTNWNQVLKVCDMPASYRDGSLFISRKPAVPWERTP